MSSIVPSREHLDLPLNQTLKRSRTLSVVLLIGSKAISCETENIKNVILTRPDDAIQCEICQKVCPNERFLRSHTLNHRKYYCEPCGREFVGKTMFKKHMKKTHNNGPPPRTTVTETPLPRSSMLMATAL